MADNKDEKTAKKGMIRKGSSGGHGGSVKRTGDKQLEKKKTRKTEQSASKDKKDGN